MMRGLRYRVLVTVVLVVLSAASAAAQEFRATIRGQILDSSKGALPGVTVAAQNVETNEVASAVSNADGSYTIPFLRPGSYTLTAELPGFQKYTRSGLVLEVNQTATINVQLGVGGLTEEVNVTAESPLLETSNASRGTVIDNKRIAELPLQSRNPFALSVLVAGVNYNAQAIYLRPFDNGALADWSMNGGQNRNNEILLDGAPNNANTTSSDGRHSGRWTSTLRRPRRLPTGCGCKCVSSRSTCSTVRCMTSASTTATPAAPTSAGSTATRPGSRTSSASSSSGSA